MIILIIIISFLNKKLLYNIIINYYKKYLKYKLKYLNLKKNMTGGAVSTM